MKDSIKQPLVSVIIPCYNAAPYIGKTMESVLSQTYKNIELIIVDDGSTDNSKQIIESYQNKNQIIELIYQKNCGVSVARNNGIKSSKGKYIAFLDADDLFLADNINQKMNFLLQTKDYKIVISDYYIFNESNKSKKTITQIESLLQNILYFEGEGIAGSSNILLEKRIFNDVGLFNPKLSTSADKHMWIKILAKYKMGYVPESLFMYRTHDAQMHSNIPLMAHDWKIILNEIKQRKLILPKHISYNKTYTIVNQVIAFSFLSKKKYLKGIIYILKSFLKNPFWVFNKIREHI